MQLKHATAKFITVTLSTMLFATLWGWIAAARDDAPVSSDDTASSALGLTAAATPETVVRRMMVVRTHNADGTITEQVVPETEYAPPAARQPVARSRGS
jgi:hypothetical protein